MFRAFLRWFGVFVSLFGPPCVVGRAISRLCGRSLVLVFIATGGPGWVDVEK